MSEPPAEAKTEDSTDGAHNRSKEKNRRWWRQISNAQATVVAALIVTVPPIISGAVAYRVKPDRETLVRESLEQQLPERTGWTAHAYPHLGIGFLAPSSWIADDAAARVAGGDADIIKRYEAVSGAAIGVQFRVQSVQSNYIERPSRQVRNQLDLDQKRDANATVSDVVVAGQPAKVFAFQHPTGQRIGEVRRYWLRLIPEVQLEILAFIYTDSPDRIEFWSEVDSIVGSVVVDTAEYQRRREKLKS